MPGKHNMIRRDQDGPGRNYTSIRQVLKPADSYSVSFAGNKAYRGKVLLKNYFSVYRKSRIATKIGI